MADGLIASRRHFFVALFIVAGITALGVRTAGGSGPASMRGSRVGFYVVLITLQIFWVRFIARGLHARGRRLADLTGGAGTPRAWAADAAFGLAGLVVTRAASLAVQTIVAGPPARTAFLLPAGPAESVLWVVVSCVAGFSEEVVYRGYLQRQVTALTGSGTAGLVFQAVLFGVSHGYQGLGSVAVTGTYGLALGVLAWWRGNVRAAMLAHALTDVIGGLSAG